MGSPTISNSIISGVAGWLEYLKQLKLKNKRGAAFGSYGWSGESVNIIQDKLREAGFDVIDENVKSLWNPTDEDFNQAKVLVSSILA